MDRIEIATLIADRLQAEQASTILKYAHTAAEIGHFVIDDLLPRDLALEIASAFPAKEIMTPKRSFRECKNIMATMSECAPLVGEAIYAFHDPEVVALIGNITATPTVQPDPFLYAGGISAMGQGDFLNPHLDNSHDKDRARWRAFNLLYYVAPEWPEDGGGNLELWPDGVGGEPVTLHSRFNRLAVMVTHGKSWHSVSPITSDATRMCISNYYFTPEPMRSSDNFHVTTFRGRPEQFLIDPILRADGFARGALRKLRPNGIGRLTHFNQCA